MGSMRVYTLLVWLLVLLVTVASGSVPLYTRGEKPRSIRGFKNQALSTARGFGKRADAEMFGPDMQQTSDENSFPADWFADELQSNAELARLIVNKFIDSNQDGLLSADELLRPLFDRPQAAYK